MKLKLKDVLPNPYRDFKANPLIEEKVLSLMDSINQTGFWENVVVRKNAEGKYESAYGHHRIAAALRAKVTEADFIVKNFDDAQMIQVMDNENRETYGATLHTLIESVKAVVQALAKGKISDFEIDPKVNVSQIRYAPSFVPGVSVPSDGTHPYTAATVAQFLGRTKKLGGRDAERADDTITAALNALHLKEIGRFSDSLFYTKDRTGEKKPTTIKEFVKITNDIKREVELDTKTKREEEAAEQKALKQKLAIEKAARDREKQLEAARDESRRKEVAARLEENTKEVARQQQRQKDLAERAAEKAVIDKVKIVKIDEAVERTKKEVEEKAKAHVESLVIRDVNAYVEKLELLREQLTDRTKSLLKMNPSLKQKQHVWEQLQMFSQFVDGWVAAQFVGSGAPTGKLKKKPEPPKRRRR